MKRESGSLLPIIQNIIFGSLDRDCNKIKGCGTCYKPSLKLGTILKQLHSRISSESSRPDPASCSSSSGRLGCANKHNEAHKYVFKQDLVCRPFFSQFASIFLYCDSKKVSPTITAFRQSFNLKRRSLIQNLPYILCTLDSGIDVDCVNRSLYPLE